MAWIKFIILLQHRLIDCSSCVRRKWARRDVKVQDWPTPRRAPAFASWLPATPQIQSMPFMRRNKDADFYSGSPKIPKFKASVLSPNRMIEKKMRSVFVTVNILSPHQGLFWIKKLCDVWRDRIVGWNYIREIVTNWCALSFRLGESNSILAIFYNHANKRQPELTF